MNLLCALTQGEIVLVIMLPIIAAVIIAVLAILFAAKRKDKSNADAPRTITTDTVIPKKPEQQKAKPEPRKPVEDERPKPARTEPTEILLTPSAPAPAPETVEEEIDTPSPEATEEDAPTQAAETHDAVETAEASDSTATEEPQAEEKPLKIRYVRSFTAKLILAPEPLKEYYAEISNKLLSYAKVKNRIGWSMSSFNMGRNKLCKINVRGKSIYMHVALDPKDFAEAKFKVKDVSEKKRYALVPCRFKVRSPRAKKHALELIDKLAEHYELSPAKKQVEPITASAYPADTEENLIERKLIKVKTSGGDVPFAMKRPEAVKQPEQKAAPLAQKQPEIKVLKSVSVSQAQQLMTSEVAATLIKTERIMHTAGKKYAVNIDVLSANFNNGDKVDIAALKAKHIVPKRETAIKILARGTLNKKLIIRADDFSADAVKMIALTGGQAIKLKH